MQEKFMHFTPIKAYVFGKPSMNNTRQQKKFLDVSQGFSIILG